MYCSFDEYGESDSEIREWELKRKGRGGQMSLKKEMFKRRFI